MFRLWAHMHLLSLTENGEEILVGGQAVVEGVMMRAPHSYCVAVRRSDGEIITGRAAVARVSEKYPLCKYPVFRGMGTLGQAMYLGIKALQFSAKAAAPESKNSQEVREIPTWVLSLNLIISLAFFVFLYKFIPLYLTTMLQRRFPALGERFAFNLIDGLIRIAIFLGFLYLISLWKEIRRVFEYHGAEHKVVFNYESGRPLSIRNAQQFTTYHPRCGTSFLLVVMVVAIGVYSLIPYSSFAMRFIGRILLLPLIVGISYEVIRFAAKHRGGLLATLTAPGLWLQRITTQPPSDDQIEVAICALEGAMTLERAQGGQLVIA